MLEKSARRHYNSLIIQYLENPMPHRSFFLHESAVEKETSVDGEINSEIPRSQAS